MPLVIIASMPLAIHSPIPLGIIATYMPLVIYGSNMPLVIIALMHLLPTIQIINLPL